MKRSDTRATLRAVLPYLRPHGAATALSVLLSAASVFCALRLPVLIGAAIDLLLGAGAVDLAAVLPLLWRSAGVAAAMGLAQWLAGVLNDRIVREVTQELRQRAFSRIQILPLSYLDAHGSGDLLSRVVADADAFADGLLMGFSQLFTGVATILGTLVSMWRLSPLIALVVVLLTPLSFVVARFIAAHTHDLFAAQSALRGEETAFLDEMLSGQKVVKAFGREQANRAAFDALDEKLTACAEKASFYSSLTNPATRFVNSLVYAAVAFAGAAACIASGSGFTVGGLSALLSYASQYGKPFNEISGVVTELQNALACAARLLALIGEAPQTPDAPDAAVLQDVQGEVSLEDVCFSYRSDVKLIEHLCLAAKPGQRIAIVGPTGCGKTTVINLLMRFYDPDSGVIRVDGADTRHVTRKSLRAGFGMVLQDSWLKSGTVRENLLLGRPDAGGEELIAAAKAARADGFIRRLPQGYDTPLGEDGGSLSAGQKQLLCIARILLAAPPMLILDEATSSIDTRTELLIQQAFDRMMEGRTSFVVAHRLSTIRDADAILVMRDGHIVEQGRHSELLEKGGFYAALYNSQFAAEDTP